jgi:hypothetical protein
MDFLNPNFIEVSIEEMSQKIDTAVAEVLAFDEAKKSPCSKFH